MLFVTVKLTRDRGWKRIKDRVDFGFRVVASSVGLGGDSRYPQILLVLFRDVSAPPGMSLMNLITFVIIQFEVRCRVEKQATCTPGHAKSSAEMNEATPTVLPHRRGVITST